MAMCDRCSLGIAGGEKQIKHHSEMDTVTLIRTTGRRSAEFLRTADDAVWDGTFHEKKIDTSGDNIMHWTAWTCQQFPLIYSSPCFSRIKMRKSSIVGTPMYDDHAVDWTSEFRNFPVRKMRAALSWVRGSRLTCSWLARLSLTRTVDHSRVAAAGEIYSRLPLRF